jgi:hypothetical protein
MNKLVHFMTIGVRPKRLQRFYRRHPVALLGVLGLNTLVQFVGWKKWAESL